MGQHPTPPPAPMSAQAKKLRNLIFAALGLLVVLNLFIHPHEPHFGIDAYAGFWAVFGLAGAVVLGRAAKGGFVLSAQVKKRRTKYSYEGITIAWDEVEGLGSFVEVEAAAEGDYEVQKQRVLDVMSRLGLNESITSSYLQLLDEKSRKL